VGNVGLVITRRLSIVALALVVAITLPASLTAQQGQTGRTEYRFGAGFTYQGADRGSLANDIGGHGELGIMRRQSARLAVGGEAGYHGFTEMACAAIQTCTWGADWIAHAGAMATLGVRPRGIRAYAVGGMGAYYGGQSSHSASFRPGGSVGLGVVLLRSATATLSMDVRYHRFTSDVRGTNYMLPATVSLNW